MTSAGSKGMERTRIARKSARKDVLSERGSGGGGCSASETKLSFRWIKGANRRYSESFNCNKERKQRMKKLLLLVAIFAMAGIANAQQCAPQPETDACLLYNQCGTGYIDCQFDNSNCGSIGHSCGTASGSGMVCQYGQCKCDPGQGGSCSGGSGDGGPYLTDPGNGGDGGCDEFGCDVQPLPPVKPPAQSPLARFYKLKPPSWRQL